MEKKYQENDFYARFGALLGDLIVLVNNEIKTRERGKKMANKTVKIEYKEYQRMKMMAKKAEKFEKILLEIVKEF